METDQLLEFDEVQINSLSPNQMSQFSEPQKRAIRSVQNEDPKDEDPYNTNSKENVSFILS